MTEEIREAVQFEAASLLWNGARSSHPLNTYATPKEMLRLCPEYVRAFIDARTEDILKIANNTEG